jgi:hypothetical protein
LEAFRLKKNLPRLNSNNNQSNRSKGKKKKRRKKKKIPRRKWRKDLDGKVRRE